MSEKSDNRCLCFPSPKDIMPEMSNTGRGSPLEEMAMHLLDKPDDGTADFPLLSHAKVLKSPPPAKIQKAIDQIAQKLNDDPLYTNQYMIISDLSPSLLFKLQERQGFRSNAIFRLTTYEHLRKAILRIMPSRYHDQIATSFNLAVGIRLDRMGLEMDAGNWAGVGSSRFRGRNCAKEGDMGIIPGPNIGAQAQHVWPSIVAEIGVSESLNHLRADAQWWWVNSGHQTAVIVLFAVHRRPSPSVSIETWTAQHVPVQGSETRQRSREIAESCLIRPSPPATHPTALVLRCDQNVTITPTAVTNAPLRIAFQSIMRRPPVGTETDVLIDERALLNICRAAF